MFSYRELHNRDPDVALMTNDFPAMSGSEIIKPFQECLPHHYTVKSLNGALIGAFIDCSSSVNVCNSSLALQ